MSIIFKRLKYKNLLSVGDQEIEIDLSSSKSTLVVGHNGAGKSTMLDALSFVLFGKPHRSVNKPQLINSVNRKQCSVEIEFNVGHKEYKIVRGLKPNVFEIWSDGELLNQDSHSRDYQKHLETNILKLNHKSFHQVVVLGSGNFIPFMQMPTYTRRAVIEELLDIGIFSKMNGLLKIEQAELKETLARKVHSLEVVESKIDMQTTHIKKLEAISQQTSTKIDEEVGKIQVKLDELNSANTLLVHQLSATKPLQSDLESMRAKRRKLEQFDHSMSDKIINCDKHITFYTENELCPACAQDISKDVRAQKLHECTIEQDKLNVGAKELSEAINGVLVDEQLIYDKLKSLSVLNEEFNRNAATITALTDQKNKIEETRVTSTSHNDLSEAKVELDNLIDQRFVGTDAKARCTEERHYNDSIAELLKDTGIKTKIISQYLPVMNKLINDYLKILDFFVLFELDESFTETIRSRHRDEFSYSSFSEGEKSRINLALLFAWRQIGKIKHSCDTNLLILDEQFDGSLDGDGADNLLKILDSLENTNVFVISHKAEILDGKFPEKLLFTRHNNFTQMKRESDQLQPVKFP